MAPDANLEEDMLDTILKSMILYDIPCDMWAMEAISWILSVLGKPICAKLINLERSMDRPMIKICVAIRYNFKFPNAKKLRVEGRAHQNQRINIGYLNNPSVCQKCYGYGHLTWSVRVK